MNRLDRERAAFMFGAVASLTAPVIIALPHLLSAPAFAWPALLANLALVALATIAMIATHEIGHAVAAHLAGAFVYRIDLGFGYVVARLCILGIDVRIRQLPIGGVTFVDPRSHRGLRLRMAVTLAAGPLVNATIAWLVVSATAPEHTVAFATGADIGLRMAPLQAVVLANLWLVAMSVLPVAKVTDGRSLLRLPFLSPSQRRDALLLRPLFSSEDLREQGRNDEAEALLRSLLETNPDSPVILNSLGLIALERSHFEEARATFRRLLDLDLDQGTQAVVRNNIAWTSLFLDPPEALAAAEEHANAAWSIAPTVPPFRGTLGAVLVASGKADRGIRHLLYAYPRTTRARSRAEIAAWMALAEATLGRPANAAEYLDTARTTDPAAPSLQLIEAAFASGRIPPLVRDKEPDETAPPKSRPS